MTIDPASWLVAAAALAGVVALLLLLARSARAFGLAPASGRRLQLVEAIALDNRRRVLLVRCDGRDLLLLTGGGSDQLIGWLP
jgi:flagellar protein FliO/FliZ